MGDFTEVFFRHQFEGLIFAGGGGAYFRNFTVFHCTPVYQDKTRQDIYYHNITSTIFWHAVSKKTLVEACQINSQYKQKLIRGFLLQIRYTVLPIISKKQRKRKEEICVMNSKARKTNLFNATRERG